MKRRKNAFYTGQSTRVGAGTGDRLLVDRFYLNLHARLRPEDEIEIIPPQQVNPTHSLQDQLFVAADYCVRKILPEVTSLFHWGDEVTPRLRALAPIVDAVTAAAAHDAAYVTARAAARVVSAGDEGARAAADAINVTYHVGDVTCAANVAAYDVAYYVVGCVYKALVKVIEVEDEAAYNRIITLTNEMLESL